MVHRPQTDPRHGAPRSNPGMIAAIALALAAAALMVWLFLDYSQEPDSEVLREDIGVTLDSS